MDASSFEDLIFDPSKCSKLSIDKKRELVYEVSNWADSASDILHTWSRHDIVQILCAETGKERKYTGVTKTKIIEHLLEIVHEKKSQEQESENGPKRQRKSNTVICKNSACKANLNRDDVFCKRCSCCICREYDDNKDPSLWLICNSDPPFNGVPCGMSCHLECARRHEKSGISIDGQDKGLDGSFRCVYCGKLNDLLGCWRKQLVVARDTRRVDILCYRLALCQKILAGTKDYRYLCEYVDEAVSKLEEDEGPLTGLPVKKARGIVNRLPSGPEIQKLCASAIECLDMMLSKRAPSDCDVVEIGEICASSVRVGLNSSVSCCTVWHRKADDEDYPVEPTCRLSTPDVKFLVSDLTPDTDYFVKVEDNKSGSREFQFRTGSCENELKSKSSEGNCSSLSNPSSVEDEKETNRDGVKETSTGNGSNTALTGLECVPYVDRKGGGEMTKNEEEPRAGSSSKKRSKGIGDEDLEYYVKVVRRLECEGHIETEFRQKFLTWYSLRASGQEVRIVKVLIDAFIEDGEALAGQLVDTFSDVISNKRCRKVGSGFCLKLWH